MKQGNAQPNLGNSAPSERRRIQILDDRVVNQIAAGEVVERPASVVKELLENSIDAGASRVTVIIDNGGRTNIEVIDDGCGMDREDALLAVRRFGTSKIRNAEDLEAISSLGFRGEALPSIASVSSFSLTTRPSADASGFGTQLEIEGGELRETTQVRASSGTRIQVRQLFFNVPARRRFLRSEGTESSLVRNFVTDIAAAVPQLDLRLVMDGREVAHWTPHEDIFARVRALRIAGDDALRVDGRFDTPSGAIFVRALLGKPASAIANSNRLRILVNGRAVREKVILKAVRDAYGNFLKPGKYPLGVVSVELPAEDLDVNVHPQKTEVRFRASDTIYRAVRSQIGAALSNVQPLEHQLLETRSNPSWNIGGSQGFLPIQRRFAPVSWAVGESTPAGSFEGAIEPPAPVRVEPLALSEMHFLGQIFDCYLLLDDATRLVVVDMHAAHERIVYSRLFAEHREGAVPTQALLVPQVLELSPEQRLFCDRILPLLAELGIECEVLGDSQLMVRSLPGVLGNADARVVVEAVLEGVDLDSENLAADARAAFDPLLGAVLARVACHGSIRRGRLLERDEVFALLRQLEEAEAAGFCPHGRPVLKVLPLGELERMFARS